MSKQMNLSNDLNNNLNNDLNNNFNNDFNNDFNGKLGYTQCFKIINGQIVPVNMYAKIIVESEHEPKFNIKFDNID